MAYEKKYKGKLTKDNDKKKSSKGFFFLKDNIHHNKKPL